MSSKSRRKRAKRKKKKLAEPSTSETPKSPSPPIPKKEAAKQPETSFLGKTNWLLGFAGTVVGLVVSYMYFRPSVEIEVPSSDSSNTEGLFSRPFVIKNNSPWPSVYDVHVSCVVEQVVRGSRAAPQVEYMNAAPDFASPINELDAGERHSVPCTNPVITSKQPLLSANVVLSLDYIRPRIFLGRELETELSALAPDLAAETVKKLQNRLRNSGKFTKLFK